MKTKWSRIMRAVAVSVTGIVVIAPLAACSAGNGADEAGGKTTIKFSYLWSGPEAQALEKIIANYNASQSEVKVVGVSSPDFQKQLTSMSSSNGSFDISDNFGDTVGSWASKGILAPLDGYFDSEKIDTSDFVPSALNQMKYDGKTYALPIALHSLMLLYNKTLFTEAGVTPPTTMDELATAALALTKTDASGDITQLGLSETLPGGFATNMVNAFGGSWWDKDGQPSPMNEGNITAMTWYQDNIVKKVGASKIAKFVAGYGQYLSAEDPFYTGKIAMRLDGEWNGVSAPKVAPGLDWGVLTIPAAAPQYEGATQVTSSNLFIPANSKHKDAAAKFLAYLVSSGPMTDFTVALGNLPARLSLLTNASAYSNIEHFSEFATALSSPNAFAPSSAPNAAEYNVDLGKAIDSIANLTATPQEALKQLESRVQTYAK